MQVVRMEGAFAVCRGPAGDERVDTLLTGPLVAGQWALVFLGAAREVIDADRAAQVNAALAGLQALLQAAPGGHVSTCGVDDDRAMADALVRAHFPDLVDREPQLPDFLRPAH